jgi:RNA polymerase nonessential primary-like sigma factor
VTHDTRDEPAGTVGDGDVPESALVRKCVSMLEDDYHRQGGYLHLDDVHRVVSRLSLPPGEALAVWKELLVKGVVAEEVPGAHEIPEESEIEAVHADRSHAPYPAEYYAHALLSHEQEIRLSRRVRASMAISRDDATGRCSPDIKNLLDSGEEARSILILSNLRLVISFAKKQSVVASLPLEDLVQEGILGLFKAISKYEPERGFRFSTYASWWVQNYIQRAIEKTGRTIRLPSHVLAKLGQLRKRRGRLHVSLNRQPSVIELARELGWEASEVSMLLQVERDVRSLEQDGKQRGEISRPRSSSSRVLTPVVEAEHREVRNLIERSLKILDERSRRVLILRYGLRGGRPRTLEQVAKRYGVTRERIRQIQKRALEKLAASKAVDVLREYSDEG